MCSTQPLVLLGPLFGQPGCAFACRTVRTVRDKTLCSFCAGDPRPNLRPPSLPTHSVCTVIPLPNRYGPTLGCTPTGSLFAWSDVRGLLTLALFSSASSLCIVDTFAASLDWLTTHRPTDRPNPPRSPCLSFACINYTTLQLSSAKPVGVVPLPWSFEELQWTSPSSRPCKSLTMYGLPNPTRYYSRLSQYPSCSLLLPFISALSCTMYGVPNQIGGFASSS